MTSKKNITDRAKRYRAQKNRPEGPKRCNLCGSRQNIDVDHIFGDETDGAPENLMYLCRTCNTRKGITQARNRIGTRTAQYNPETTTTRGIQSLKDWKKFGEIILGFAPGSVRLATELIRNTPAGKRKKFGEQMSKNPPTYAQYAHGLSIHQRGAHDEGGAIIHSTPPALRHKYAMEIARTKRSRGTAGRSEVPF